MSSSLGFWRSAMASSALALLVGCSSTPKDEKELPATTLYTQAQRAFDEGNYNTSAHLFDEVERLHPYSEWATKGQVMSAYANYVNREFDKAIVTLDVFIQLHPGYPDIAYVYYLRALCYYDQILAVRRDQHATLEALDALNEVVQRYPDSKYARDAHLKIDLVYDHLAGKEMSVGRYYMRQDQYLAAINRFLTVLDAYPRTTHIPEALHRLVESYLSMGMYDEAQQVGAVLGHNFPGSEWYADTYLLLKGQDMRPEWVIKEEDPWYKRMMQMKFM